MAGRDLICPKPRRSNWPGVESLWCLLIGPIWLSSTISRKSSKKPENQEIDGLRRRAINLLGEGLMSKENMQIGGGWLDNFVEYVKQAIDIIQLNEDAIDRARDDEEAFMMGLVIIALGGIAAGIGSMSARVFVFSPILLIVAALVFAVILHLLATMLFKGEGEFIGFFRPYSLAFVLLWVNAIWILKSVLVLVAGFWLLVVTSSILERNYSLDRPQAIATVAIPVAALSIMWTVLFATAIAAALFLGLL